MTNAHGGGTSAAGSAGGWWLDRPPTPAATVRAQPSVAGSYVSTPADAHGSEQTQILRLLSPQGRVQRWCICRKAHGVINDGKVQCSSTHLLIPRLLVVKVQPQVCPHALAQRLQMAVRVASTTCAGSQPCCATRIGCRLHDKRAQLSGWYGVTYRRQLVGLAVILQMIALSPVTANAFVRVDDHQRYAACPA